MRIPSPNHKRLHSPNDKYYPTWYYNIMGGATFIARRAQGDHDWSRGLVTCLIKDLAKHCTVDEKACSTNVVILTKALFLHSLLGPSIIFENYAPTITNVNPASLNDLSTAAQCKLRPQPSAKKVQVEEGTFPH